MNNIKYVADIYFFFQTFEIKEVLMKGLVRVANIEKINLTIVSFSQLGHVTLTSKSLLIMTVLLVILKNTKFSSTLLYRMFLISLADKSFSVSWFIIL